MIILALIFNLFVYCEGQADAQFVMNFDSPVYVCADEDSQSFVDTSALELQRHNETAAFMTGIIKFLKGLDHSTMLEIKVEKEASGRFEMVFSHEICDICKEMGNPESDYYEYLKYFGFPDECPFEANEYSVNDLMAPTQDIPVNSANVGRYQVIMTLYNNPDGSCKNEINFISCLKLDCVIEPV